MSNWSTMLHLDDDDKPVALLTRDKHLRLNLHGANAVFPTITVFSQTPAHRAWAEEMARASEAFWAREEAAAKREIENG